MDEILTQLDGTTNVLLAGPPTGRGRELCASLLLGHESTPSVLFVTYTRSASDCLDQLDDAETGRVGVIAVGGGSTDEPEGVVTEPVSNAGDLTGLGIAIGRFLSEWEPPMLVCFDSLTPMLQYADIKKAYAFLHTVTGQIHAAGARSHFHIDPRAHDVQHVASITSLFDARVSLEGEPSVRTRELLESRY